MRLLLNPLRVLLFLLLAGVASAQDRPNVLFAISDDQSFLHTGLNSGGKLDTPAFDRIAKEGVNFTHAYCAAPSCTPSRGAILTGQEVYRIEEGGVLFGTLPAKFPVYPLLLRDAGYHVGWTGSKAWGPGDIRAGGRTEDPAGKRYSQHKLSREDHPPGTASTDVAANFKEFLGEREDGQPFCFWYGSHAPHRSYEKGIGRQYGKKLEDALLFGCFPDREEIRSDVLDYYVEIEHFDRQLGRMLALLDEAGELDNTLVIVTSDHGMPFPRCKGNLYDSGTRVPLAIRYPGRIEAGRTVEDFVSLADIAPTILSFTGAEVPDQMSGVSLLPVLESNQSGWTGMHREFVVTAFERHTPCRPGSNGYPMRMIRTRDHLYIRNYEEARWPAGSPDIDSIHQGAYGDIDNGPTKTYMIELQDEAEMAPFFSKAFGKRPAEELYAVGEDPDQLKNLASDPEQEEVRKRLAGMLNGHLEATDDPRMKGLSPWGDYPYYFKDYAEHPEKLP